MGVQILPGEILLSLCVIMNTYPFSIYKRADRPYFLVSFKNADGKFLAGISTKKKTEDEAMAVAIQWLRDGIPQKKQAFNNHELILKDTTRKIKTSTKAEALLSELKRLGWIKNGVVKSRVLISMRGL